MAYELNAKRFNDLLAKLIEWRQKDHADSIVLSRNEIIVLIEGVQPRDDAEIERLQMELRAEKQDHGAVVAGLQGEIERLSKRSF